jgi:hypothetical protein
MKYSSPRNFLVKIIIFIVLVAILVFIYSRYGRFIGGPGIKHISLDDFTSIRGGHVLVEGEFKNAKSARVNGNQLILDPQHGFSIDVALQPGDNIIDVEVTDPFGKTRYYTYHVYSELPESQKPEITIESDNDNDLDKSELVEIEIDIGNEDMPNQEETETNQ